MNPFTKECKRLIDLHGLNVTYNSVSEPVYNVSTGTATSSSTSSVIKSYPKHIKADQYNFPNLVGKEAYMFYIYNYKLSFAPKVGDTIIYNNEEYSADIIYNTVARGEVVLYRVVAVKG